MENQNNVKVLLVEDDKFLRDLCSKKLKKIDIEVIEAVNGEQAIEAIEKDHISLVLLDIVLPAIDGFEVLKQIRGHENEEVKNTPIIMLSNLGQEADVERALSLGANDYLIKAHFTTEEIVKKVKRLIAE